MMRQLVCGTLAVLTILAPMPLEAAAHPLRPHGLAEGGASIPPGSPAATGPIFADGFESGGPWLWSKASGFDFDLACEPPDPARAVAGGTVTLRGSGFSPGPVELVGEPTVRFNGLEGAVLSLAPGRIDAAIPVTATSGPVTVTISNHILTKTAECGTFTLNHAPVLQPIGDRTALLGQQLRFDVDATDLDGDSVAVTLAPLPLPRGASFDGRTFTFSPNEGQVGTFPLTFSASDGANAVSESITLTVPQPAARTTLAGIVLTAGSAPLANVRLVFGSGVTVETFSQADGTFFFPDIPFAGQHRLLIDGSTAAGSPPGTFATVPEKVSVVAGGANQLRAPIFLLPLDLENADPVMPDRESLLDSGPIEANGQMHPAVEITVAPSSAMNDATQQPFDGVVSITQVPSPDLGPMPLPEDFDLAVYIAVQPFGVRYEPPAEIAFPNVEGFPVGSVVDILALNHDTGVMEKVGDGIVQSDGMIHSGTLREDGSFELHGVVRENSWHGFVPQPADGEDDSASSGGGGGDPPPCGVGSEGCPRTGDLSVTHDLVAYRSLGTRRSLRLAYHSQHAFAHPVVSRLWTPGNLTPAPTSMSMRLELGGIEVGPEIHFQGPPCSRFNCPQGRFPYAADATPFATGVYPAELTLSCNFRVSRRDTVYTQNVQVVNQIRSPFGAGWSLMGLERVHQTATGDLLLTDGETEGLIFTPARRAAAEIVEPGERDLYRLVGRRGQTVSLRMKRRSTEADGSSALDPALELRDSRGFVLVSDNDSGTSAVEGPGDDAEILAFTLPATDTYEVVARGAGGTTGPYHLFLTAASATAFGTRFGAPERVDPAVVVNGEITSSGQEDSHPFAADAGTKVSIELARLANQADGSGSLDPSVELRDSRGILLYSDNDTGTNVPPGPGRNAVIASVTLPATDTYSVVARGSAGTVGPYELRITFSDLAGLVDAPGGGQIEIEPVVLSPRGEFSTLTDNDDGTFTRRMPDGIVKSFDAAGFLTRVADRNGNATLYSYDTEGRLTAITDTQGQVTTLRYSSPGTLCETLTEIRDPAGRTTTFEHDSQCNLIRITDPDGAARRFEYDANHLLVRQIPARGVAASDPDAFATSYEYDFSGRFRRSTLPDNSTRELVSDQSIGLVEPPASCTGAAPSAGCPQNLVLAVPRSDVQLSFTDAEDRITNLGSPEPLGNPGSLTDPMGRVTTIERNNEGNPTRITLPSGHATTMTFDDKGNLSTLTDSILRGTNSFEYERQLNLPAALTDPLGNTTRISYDSAGNPVRLTSAMGRTVDFTYDANGLPVSAVGSGGETTQYSYGQTGLVEEIRKVAGIEERTTGFSYTPEGELATVTDPMGRTTSFEYDSSSRLTVQTLPDGRQIRFSYDAEGRLSSVEPPGRFAHVFRYDSRGNHTEEVPPAVSGSMARTAFFYNKEHQLTRVVNPDGQSADLTYNSAGQLATITTPQGDYRYTYGASTGLLGSIRTPAGDSLGFEYNGSLPVKTTWSGIVNGSTSSVFSAGGNLASRAVNGGPEVRFVYDADGFLVNSGEIELIRSPENGALTGTSIAGISTEISYNGFAEVVADSARFGPNDLYSNSYTRDAIGRITRKEESIEGASTIHEYEYDETGRLTAVSKNGSTAASYQYDRNGNRLSLSGPGGVVTGTYDDQDRITAYGSLRFSYTGNGELRTKLDSVSGETTSYNYDLLSNMVGASLPDGRSIEYRVDGAGRRIAKLVDGAFNEGYIYGDNPNPIATVDAAGAVTSRFVYGSRLNVPDYVLKNGSTYRIISDHLGSPRLVVEVDTGAVVQRIDYDEFGNVLQDTQPGFQPFAFAGGLYDPDTGLVHFGARDYDPEIGRWLSKDPLRFGAGDTNLYGYAFNDPINLSDPTGEFVPFALVFAGAAIGAAMNVGLTVAADLLSGRELSTRRIVGAAVSGAISGAVGGVAFPVAGTLARAVGGVAGKLGARLLDATISAAGGALGQLAQNQIDPPEIDPCSNAGSPLNAALFAGAGGFLGTFFPSRGIQTLKQARFFTPKFTNLLKTPNSRGIVKGMAVGSGIGSAAAFFDGPF